VRNWIITKVRKYVDRQGFTLIEVLVASLLLLFAMAGIVPVFLSSLNHSSAVRYKSAATNIARERMEEIRQLDSRAITSAADLETLFGTSATQRDIDFNVSYDVEESTYESGLLKRVTITVGWDGPPAGSAAQVTTMIHQQFLGPRIAWLELSKSKTDPLGTPFPCLYENQLHTLTCHIASADWALVLDHLNEPGMTARDVYMRLFLVDSNSQSLALGDAANDNQITDLVYTTDLDGHVTDVYFEYTFDSGDIADGYWEFRAIAYNEYDEPGNTWRLRTRIENGAPSAPTGLVAVPQADNENIILYWSGGAERDRAYYVLERRIWEGADWSATWETLESTLDPRATNYKDAGDASASLDPWGDAVTQNWYQYRIWAVDICDPGRIGPEAIAETGLPDPTTTTTLPVTTTTSASTTTTEAPLSTVYVENTINKVYSLHIEGDNGVVLSTSVGKKSTAEITSLPAGNYLMTATCSGRPTLTQSFSLPAQAGQTVMTIL